MPGYDEHRRLAETVGAIAPIVLGLVAWTLANDAALAVTAGCLGFVALTIGSQLPDVDAPGSIPRRRLTRLLQVVAVGGLVGAALGRSEALLDAAEQFARAVDVEVSAPFVAAAGVALTVLAVAVAVPAVLDRTIPPHRGPLHDVRFWIVSLSLAVAVVYAFDVELAGGSPVRRHVVVGSVAGGLLLGVVTHLAADRELR